MHILNIEISQSSPKKKFGVRALFGKFGVRALFGAQALKQFAIGTPPASPKRYTDGACGLERFGMRKKIDPKCALTPN
jgi:hypothetical protein